MVTIVLIDFLITLILSYFYIKVRFDRDELKARVEDLETKNKVLIQYYEDTCKMLKPKR